MTNQGIYLGVKPETLRVTLTTGADFHCILRADTPWPAGAAVSLQLGAQTWAATVAGTDATFNVDKAVADQITKDTTARLVYSNGSEDQVWAVGTVVR